MDADVEKGTMPTTLFAFAQKWLARDSRVRTEVLTWQECGVSGELVIAYVDKHRGVPVSFGSIHERVGEERWAVLGATAINSAEPVLLSRSSDRAVRVRVASALVGLAERTAAAQGYPCRSVRIPGQWIPVFVRPGSTVSFCDTQSRLIIPRVRNLSEFLSLQPRRVRRYYVRDQHDRDALGMITQVLPAERSLTREFSPLFSSVSLHNGVQDSPRLAQYWMEEAISCWPGSSWYAVSMINDVVHGVALLLRMGTLMMGHSVGLREASPHRREAYNITTYLASVEEAIRSGVREIVLGWGHAYPKAMRGAEQEDIWDVCFANDRPTE